MLKIACWSTLCPRRNDSFERLMPMPKIRFKATLMTIGSQTILRLPQAASSRLPSRGMSMVEGTVDGHAFRAPLEPDGMGSHWLRVRNTMLKAARVRAGDSVSVALEPMALWPEPKIPADLAAALASDQQARRVWLDITPLARWDWIRWIGSTRNRDTRVIRIGKTLSKLRSGKRAACCFDRSQCTDPSVSHNGALLEPTLTTRSSWRRDARSTEADRIRRARGARTNAARRRPENEGRKVP